MKRHPAPGASPSGFSPASTTRGAEERIVVWIERKPGAVWAVGRAVNVHLRPSDEPRPDDYVFEGFELDDALERANDVLEDDVRVLEGDGAGTRR